MYGFPAKHIRKEQTANLKLVVDMLFTNGVIKFSYTEVRVTFDTIYYCLASHY